ncbi:MAG: class I SAM-dependent methyltransferase [Chloroflexi bacterium]|nr:class I SAM-dependent methyltransferase [Chloroflexota bacterium]
MDASEYDNIARLEARHWWYRGMAAISLILLAEGVSRTAPGLQLLDAGCGAGGMLTRLASFGKPVGIDFHPLALAHAARATNSPLARASVQGLPFAPRSFDVVTSFDVLYHRAVTDDDAALREFARVLRPGGWLLVRVPALEQLRGAHDTVVHTRHRYSARELRSKLQAAGFLPRRVTYANTLLALPVLLRRTLQTITGAHETTDVELPPPALNRLLEFVLTLEAQWLARFDLPVGVSLFALARRP